MGDLGNVFDSLYERLIMRDLLSYITPGAIVVISVLLLWQSPSYLLDNLRRIHWVLYIPIFGFLFLVGHALQDFGAKLVPMWFRLPPFIRIYYSFIDRDSCTYDALSCVQRRIRSFERKLDKMSDWERKRVSLRYERLTALKQMCGHAFFAVSIAGVLLTVKHFCPNSLLLPPLATGVLAIVLVASLICGHIHSWQEEGALENVVLEEPSEEQR